MVAFAIIISSLVAAQTSPSGNADSPLPRVPDVRLAVIDYLEGETTYQRPIAERASTLARRAEQANDPLARADLLLAAANLILSHQLEPACTRALLGILDRSDTNMLRADLEAKLNRANELLAAAESVLDASKEQEERSVERRRALNHILDTLQAFRQALGAFLLPEGDAKARRPARRAASRLAALLEERDPRIAAATRLWHAALRGRESDPTPALLALDLALADPPKRGLPYVFFAHLLRGRLLAARGGYPTALALLAQLEERCAVWFSNETDRGDALRAATLVEIRILIDWREELAPATQAPERRWCVERVKTLIDERLSGPDHTVLRLGRAIPIIAHPPGSDRSTSPTVPNGD